MAQIIVGVVGMRQPDGTFGPGKPIYREVDDSIGTYGPEQLAEKYDYDEFCEYLFEKIRRYKAARMKEKREERQLAGNLPVTCREQVHHGKHG